MTCTHIGRANVHGIQRTVLASGFFPSDGGNTISKAFQAKSDALRAQINAAPPLPPRVTLDPPKQLEASAAAEIAARYGVGLSPKYGKQG